MATNRNIVRPKGAPGMKALVTTASLAATLAGWATLSINTPAAPVTAHVTLPVEVEQQQATPVIVMAPPPAWLRQEPSLPDIPAVATVQPIGGEPALVAARPHHITVPSIPVESAPVDAAPVAAAPVESAPVESAPAEAAPAPAAAAPAPELRSVAPPPPAPTARPAAAPAPKPAAAAPAPKPAAPAKTKSSR